MTSRFIVYYKNNTYDLRNFIDSHPGGSIIQFAENREIDKLLPYYHSNMESIERILEKYKIADSIEPSSVGSSIDKRSGSDKYEYIRSRIWNKIRFIIQR